MLPEINTIQAKDEIISRFLGLNQKDTSNTETSKDMLNMTSDEYPYLSPRPKADIREVYSDSYYSVLGSCVYGEDIYTVQGYLSSGTATVKLFKNFEVITGVTLQANMGLRQLLVYGAYIAIFPDHILYNTEDHSVKSMTFEETITGTAPSGTGGFVPSSELYLSDKNAYPYVCDYHINPLLAAGNSDTIKNNDNTLNSYFYNSIEYRSKGIYLPQKTVSYETGDSQILTLPFNILLSRKEYVKNYSGNTSFNISYLNANSDGELAVYKYNQAMSSFMPEDTFVTWIVDSRDITDAISIGDYIKFECYKSDNSRYSEDDFENKDKLWALIQKLENGIKVENIIEDSSYTRIVFSNNGLDLLNVLKLFESVKMKYGRYPDNPQEPSAYYREINYLDNRLGFGWGNTTGTAVDHVKITKKVPEMDYVTVSENRIWGCSSTNHEIYACKQGDATSWYQYAGLSSDSYAVTIPSGDKFTGAITYSEMPYFFTEKMAYSVIGNKPKNYQVQKYELRGVEDGAYRTIAQKDGYVYYKSKSGIERFNGNNSQSLTEYLDLEGKNGYIGATNNDKYFVYLGQDGDTKLYVYDIKKRQWHIDRKDIPTAMVELDNNLYQLRGTTGKINLIKLNGKAREIAEVLTDQTITVTKDTPKWFVESGEFNGNLILNKYVTKFMFEMKLEQGSNVSISFMYNDSGEWEKVFKTTDDHVKRIIKVPILVKRCERMRYKIEGEGMAKIYSIVITYEGGSENG